MSNVREGLKMKKKDVSSILVGRLFVVSTILSVICFLVAGDAVYRQGYEMRFTLCGIIAVLSTAIALGTCKASKLIKKPTKLNVIMSEIWDTITLA